ncbi:MAG: metal-dependent transcriptional regulator [Bacteroidetes bacterium]|nr:metal-dependent transcriptional regulator [Bacteroidota bacterium]
MQISFTEENYLKAIYHLSTEGKVSTNELSKYFSLKPASVTEMLKKLNDKKLIKHQKYKPVSLTKKGSDIAIKIIRGHRLWEKFLVDKLNYNWHEVHDIAEQLEHIKSDDLLNKLEKYLGYPKFDPHGDPIPDKNGILHPIKAKVLNKIKTIGNYKLIGLTKHNQKLLEFLNAIKLNLNEVFLIQKINLIDNSFQLKIKKRDAVLISNDVASLLLVNKI